MLLRREDFVSYLASLFIPGQKRGAVQSLWALSALLREIPLKVREPLAAEIRLQWWREVLGGKRDAEAAGHPVAAAALAVARDFGIPPLLWERYFDGHSASYAPSCYETMAGFERVAEEREGNLIRIAAHLLLSETELGVLEFSDGAMFSLLCRYAAIAQHSFYFLQDLSRARGQQIAFPKDLSSYPELTGLREKALPLSLSEKLLALCRLAYGHGQAARALWLPTCPAALRVVFLPLFVQLTILSDCAKDPLELLRTPPRISPLRQQWRLLQWVRTAQSFEKSRSVALSDSPIQEGGRFC